MQGGVSRQAHQLQPHDGPAELAVIQVATAVCVRFVEERARGFQACRANSATRSLRRALLPPQVNPGSLYRCGKRT